MAEKRLQHLQIRFFKDYREFMEECIVKVKKGCQSKKFQLAQHGTFCTMVFTMPINQARFV